MDGEPRFRAGGSVAGHSKATRLGSRGPASHGVYIDLGEVAWDILPTILVALTVRCSGSTRS